MKSLMQGFADTAPRAAMSRLTDSLTALTPKKLNTNPHRLFALAALNV